MWSPTHIQVTVQRAKGLLMKGKGGTNNCFVIIALGKEKYQTSIKEKAPESVIWNEECELQIPSQGNQAQLVLTALHRNTMGMDEFLGRVVLPLNEMDVYERPRSRWHKLESKDREKKKEKERGELEVRISFTVKAGSLTDLSKKEKSKSSISNLASSVGGSLLSIGAIEKRKGLKKIAKSIGSKMHISGLGKGKGKESGGGPDDGSSMYSGSYSSLSGVGAGGNGNGSSAATLVAGGGSSLGGRQSKQTFGDADPGVISEDEDEFVLDNLSHKSSNGSLNLRAAKNEERSPTTLRQHPPNVPARTAHSLPSAELGAEEKAPPPPAPAAGTKVDEWEQKLYGRNHLLDIGSTDSLKRRSWESSRVMLSVQQEDQEQEAAEREANDADVGQPRGQRGSMTAPTSPDLDGSAKAAAAAPPKPLPRVGSQDTAVGRQSPAPAASHEAKPEKESFTKKLKHFVKDRSGAHRADSLENLSTAAATATAAGKKLGAKRQQGGGGGIGSGSADQRIIIGGEHGGADGMTMASAAAAAAAQRQSKLAQVSPETLAKYEGKSREEVIRIAHNLESEVHYQKQKVKELEDYLDSLLLKVMECHPKILQNPYQKATPTKSG
ncbi:rab11 family-interacting protein 1 [Anopheles ziemanni]|uniref:rab11 family-interacting protein 1 n=1 Tax=Anopheles coustani TaxID=139045 RepID=UPI00265B5623|nr:rab11 family-interacting protein 1 [Anopheles coustani]XP_058176507.1 rab11 family-interacting protein 1 [Anopheles ziemanni]